MASVAKISSGQQWRKYTNGNTPRDLNFHILFFMCARLELEPSQLQAIYKAMQDVGATLDVEALISRPKLHPAYKKSTTENL